MENTTALWPVTLHTSNSQVTVSTDEEEVVINTLLLGDSGRKTKSINATSNTDTGGVDGCSGVNVSGDFVDIHVRGVLGISADSMVVLDDSIKDLREILVTIPVTSIDTTVLVVELNGTGTSLGDGEAAGLGLDVLDTVPSLLGHVLLHERVLGLDNWEISRHD